MPAPRPPRRAWQRPGGWLLATGIGVLLAIAAIGWVQWRQMALLGSAVQGERDKLVWRFLQQESDVLQLRDLLHEAQLEPGDPVRAAVAERVRQQFDRLASRLPPLQPQRAAPLVDFGQDHLLAMAALEAFVRRHQPVLGAAATRPLTQQAAVAALAELSGLRA